MIVVLSLNYFYAGNMPTIEQLLSKLSPEWSLEPGRTNTIRASLRKGFIAISLFEKRMCSKLTSNYNVVAEILAPNNTLLDQAYFSNVDDCIEYANRLRATP